MSIFDISNFEREGNTQNDILLENNENICESINLLTDSALRSIKIFTPDLQRDLYDNDRFRDNLLKFVRGNRHAKIQILVNDSSFAIHQGHRLIRLAQQLTTAMQIRNTPEDYQETNMAFILIDHSDFIFKPNSSSTTALHTSCKHRGNKLNEFFTPAWEHAVLDPQIRQISL